MEDLDELKRDLADIEKARGESHPLGQLVAEELRAEIAKLEGGHHEPQHLGRKMTDWELKQAANEADRKKVKWALDERIIEPEKD